MMKAAMNEVVTEAAKVATEEVPPVAPVAVKVKKKKGGNTVKHLSKGHFGTSMFCP